MERGLLNKKYNNFTIIIICINSYNSIFYCSNIFKYLDNNYLYYNCVYLCYWLYDNLCIK